MDPEEIDPAKVMREIREAVRRAYSSRKNSMGLYCPDVALDFDIRVKKDLKTNKPLKPLVLKIRKILQGEVQWYVDPIVERQIEFNSKLVTILRNMDELIRGLKLDLEGVKESLKMMCDRIELLSARFDKLIDKSSRSGNFKPDWLDKLDILKAAYSYNPPSSERFTEYLWVLRNLIKRGRILDVGCTESLLPQMLAEFPELEVYGIDIRPYENGINVRPKFKFFQEDALHTHFPNEFFDQILAISSIEHFGLKWYGNEKPDPEADKKAMKEMHRILKRNGSILVTVPFGVGEGRFYRVYNKRTLEDLFKGFRIEKCEFFVLKGHMWMKSDLENASKMDGSEKVTSIACIKAVRELPHSISG
ncbi:MAG: class I SAM-dependent methyltransferase [Candidatus Bathyarchaeia archaeon]